MARPHKYHAQRTEVDGITFASKAEASRYTELRLLVRAGEIRRFRLQPEYVLGDVAYRADFEVVDRHGLTHAEDVKGIETPRFRLVRKLWPKYRSLALVILKRKRNGWAREVVDGLGAPGEKTDKERMMRSATTANDAKKKGDARGRTGPGGIMPAPVRKKPTARAKKGKPRDGLAALWLQAQKCQRAVMQKNGELAGIRDLRQDVKADTENRRGLLRAALSAQYANACEVQRDRWSTVKAHRAALLKNEGRLEELAKEARAVRKEGKRLMGELFEVIRRVDEPLLFEKDAAKRAARKEKKGGADD